ncbi:MAG TPA: YfiR family protein [Bacteroidales bacterium]|nr:YfiR family protein [Bacteroidales bacterium]
MKIGKIILVSLVLIFSFTKGNSQTSIAKGQSVFIYNFTRLIEWPEEAKSGNFVIAVYGSAELASEIKNYTNSKSVGSQQIEVVKCNSLEEIRNPHILFVAFGKTKEMDAIRNKVGNNHTLIIGEKKGVLELGAAINFVIVDDKLKFELKSSNAAKAGLKIHSTLENMAVAKY